MAALRRLQATSPPTKQPFAKRSVTETRLFVEWLGGRLGYKDKKDWYRIKPKDFVSQEGRTLLMKYNHSLWDVLGDAYPDDDWCPWMFKAIKRDHWKDVKLQEEYLTWFGHLHKLKYFSDWYHVTTKDFTNNYGATFLSFFGHTSFFTINTIYHHFNWIPWKFLLTSKGFWQNQLHHVQYLHWLGKILQIKKMSDFYKISQKDFDGNYGKGLLSYYDESPINVLQLMYDQFFWRPWKSKKTLQGFWYKKENHMRYLDWLGTLRSYKTYEDWHQVHQEDIIEQHGGSLLICYGNSSLAMLKAVYVEFKWQAWTFARASNEYWKEPHNMQGLLHFLEGELRIHNLDDWYRVSIPQIADRGGLHAIVMGGGLVSVLPKYFPGHNWDKRLFTRKGKKAIQRFLFELLKELFPNTLLLEDFIHPDMSFSKSNQKMQLDIYIPELFLAFEFQGQQHFSQNHFFGDGKSQSERDEEKREACMKNGITLVEIPFWWDQSKEQLVVAVREKRPELFCEN